MDDTLQITSIWHHEYPNGDELVASVVAYPKGRAVEIRRFRTDSAGHLYPAGGLRVSARLLPRLGDAVTALEQAIEAPAA